MVACIIAEQPWRLCIIASCSCYSAVDLTVALTNILKIRINKSELSTTPQESPLKPQILPQSLAICADATVGVARAGRVGRGWFRQDIHEGEVGSVVSVGVRAPFASW